MGRKKIAKELHPKPEQHVFFTAIQYGEARHIKTKAVFKLNSNTEVLLVTGIANPLPLKKMLEENSKAYYMQQYPDHHIFTIDDLREISKRFKQIEAEEKIILTTEKDAVRLVKFDAELTNLPLFVIPVRHDFLFGEEEKFNELVIDFIRNFGKTQ
jgi:tetraacyldisaccharide 4'-kinase